MTCYRTDCGCRGGSTSDIYYCDCARLCTGRIVGNDITYGTETEAEIPEGQHLTDYEKSVFKELVEDGLATEEAINVLSEM